MAAVPAIGVSTAAAAAEVRVSQVSPQGEVAEVRQVVVRFDGPAVAAGDPRAVAPFALRCNGSAPAGDARWLDDRRWAFDLREALPSGQRCTLAVVPGWQPLQGALAGATSFEFATGAPVVLSVLPYAGQPVEEGQQFLLRLNGAVDAASVEKSAWCEVDGLGDRIAVRVLGEPAQAALLQALRRAPRSSGASRSVQHHLLLECVRPLPAESRVRLVWGPGIAAAGQPGLQSRQAQRFQWPVRKRLLAEFSCERENARAPCMPLRPMVLRFSAPVPRELALAARLQRTGVTPAAPALAAQADPDERGPTLQQVRFAAPLPESASFTLTLPPGLKDETGRALHNAAGFPLAVATGPMPPLAKFASGAFGIVEAGSAQEPALLPLTLRHVQADLAGARTGGQLRIKRLAPDSSDEQLLQWLTRVRADYADAWNTRAKPMLAREADARPAELPQLQGQDPRSAEVLGVPLPGRGLHVVEAESRILGHALLEPKAPMHARTAVLVTNLGVHFKRGRSSSLVWVTTLDRARPVPGARVAVADCRGKTLWSGSTDGAGIARIDRGFEDDDDEQRCPHGEGLFVSARTGSGAAQDLGFVFSRWSRGIESWRFNIATASGPMGGVMDRRAHTVFDRTLLRVGETLSMKHFVRQATAGGLAALAPEQLPDEVVLTHVGSDRRTSLPLRWPSARSAESRWTVPQSAPLGLYDVALKRGETMLASGQFRVEAFRVPLVDARLTPPPGALVAPTELALSAQVGAMAGGPMPGLPLQLSALLRPLSPQFKGYEEFSFEPPSQALRQGEEGDEAERSVLVADKLAVRTDAQGAARLTIGRLPPLAGAAELQAELSFADPNGETQTVSRRLRLWPAALVVGLRAPGWAASPRGEIAFTAVVLDTEGRPVAGRAVEVQGRRHQTLSVRKRLVGGFYAYDNHRETQELGALCSGRSDAMGRVACQAAVPQGGEIELVASVRDDAGRTARAATTAWVADGERWWFAQDQDDRIDLLPEQRELQPGQTARLQVRMPFAQATALVTVEREGVIDARVMTLSGREPVIELPIPQGPSGDAGLQGSWAPNVVVSAFVLRGRLREAPWWSVFTWGWKEPGEWWRAFRYENKEYRAPTGLVDLAKPSFKLGAAELRVGLAEHRLDVRVRTPAAQYKVRETVRATVSVTRGGKPAAGAQVAFAAVDEGLLALQENSSWQLLEAMLQPRPWGVETATAQGEVIGRRHYGRKALPPGGGGGRNPTRELFDTLLLWRGTVQLDAQGQATIDVPLNDSLTSFRLVAIADDGAARFGSGSTSIRVTQELQLLPGLAPLARSGDTFEAGFTLRNTTARAMTVRAQLAGQAEGGGALPALDARTVQLAAGAASELRWPVSVPAGATRIDWEASAEEQGAPVGTTAVRDRVRIAQAIAPAVPVRVLQASLRPLEGAFSLALAPPADALPGSARVTVALQPRLSGALPGLRRWFEQYPFTCLEQKASRAIALRDEALWAQLRDELAGHLDADGLALYFPPSAGAAPRGSDRLTSHLLSAAHEAGWAWPDAQREAMLQGLAAFVEGRIERRFNAPRADLDVRKLAALEALARHGRVAPRMLGSIAWAPAAWPTSALLDAWSLYRRVDAVPDRAARLDELQRLVRSRLVAGGTTLAFTTERDDDWWWLMDGPDANAARLLLAASTEPAWKDDVAQILTGTLARQRGGAWLTTTANVWGVLALERFAANFERTPVAGRSTLQLGSSTRALDWAATPAGAVLTLPLPAAAPLQARHEGAGRPWLTLQSLAAVPLQAPLFAGYRITKTLTPVQQKQPGAWSRGDIARVRIEVQAGGDMAWVVVADPIPSGAKVLGGGLGRDSAIATRGEQREGTAWPAYEERAADAWRGYYEWMPRGRQVVEYTLRLNSAGRFGLPPTRVEAMYAPETFGELPNAVWEVRP